MSSMNKQVFTAVIASGASTASNIDLGPKSFSRIFAEIGTMSTNMIVNVYGSNDGTVYKPIFERVPNTTSVQWQAVAVATAAVGSVIPLDDLNGVRYAQFRGTGVVSGGCTISVICVD